MGMVWCARHGAWVRLAGVACRLGWVRSLRPRRRAVVAGRAGFDLLCPAAGGHPQRVQAGTRACSLPRQQGHSPLPLANQAVGHGPGQGALAPLPYRQPQHPGP